MWCIFAESAWTLPAPRDAARPTGGIFALTYDETYSFLVVQSGWESWFSHPGPCFLTRVCSWFLYWFQWNRSRACANWDWPPSRGAIALCRHVNAFHLLFQFLIFKIPSGHRNSWLRLPLNQRLSGPGLRQQYVIENMTNKMYWHGLLAKLFCCWVQTVTSYVEHCVSGNQQEAAPLFMSQFFDCLHESSIVREVDVSNVVVIPVQNRLTHQILRM